MQTLKKPVDTVCSNPALLKAQRHFEDMEREQNRINQRIQADALKRHQEESARRYYDNEYTNNCILHGYEKMPFFVWLEEFKYSKLSQSW
jgi:hypothetical protein